MRGSDGINELQRAIAGHVGRQVKIPTVLSYATVQADLSLALDVAMDAGNSPILVPKGEYFVLDWLTQPDPIDAATGPASAGTAHTHTVPRPATMGPLVAGDRVLVAWGGAGNDAVVVGRLRGS